MLYQFDIKTFAFSESRYINAHIDYGIYKQQKKRFQKLYVDEGNQLGAYTTNDNFKFFENRDYENIRIEVYDSKYNKSVLSFVVKKNKGVQSSIKRPEKNKTNLFKWNQPNVFKHQNFSVTTPANSFYKNCYLDFKTTNNSDYVGGLIYELGNPLIPVHKKIDLKIKLPNVSKQHLSKLTLVELDGKDISAINSRIQEGYLTAKIRSFGRFSILMDTVPPQIQLVSKNLRAKQKVFIFKITDALSGIGSYSAFLNGKWILFKYDYKTDYYYYDKDFSLQKRNAEQVLKIKVTDKKGNVRTKTLKFVY